jgi:uncharacterized protein DUF6919
MRQLPEQATGIDWARARTMQDLAACTAAWLRRSLPNRPGRPDQSPDSALDPLLAGLAEAADAGFVLAAAHPARPTAAVGGRIRRWRAAAHGHVADDRLLHRLVDAAEESGLLCIVQHPWHPADGDQVAVATTDGTPQLSYRPAGSPAERERRWPGLHPDALDALHASREVILAAPQFGPDGDFLWDVLWEAACLADDDPDPAPAICIWCGCTEARRCTPGCTWTTAVSSAWICTACLMNATAPTGIQIG